jgi:hypothetical protein
MSVAYVFKIPASEEEYRRVADDAHGGDAPEGLVIHAAGMADDGSRMLVEVWESEDAAERFTRDRLMPAFARHGISPDGGERTTIAVDNLAGAAAAAR